MYVCMYVCMYVYTHTHTLFPGIGGQSAVIMNPAADDLPAKCGHEINFFNKRSRSMIICLWSREAGVLKLR